MEIRPQLAALMVLVCLGTTLLVVFCKPKQESHEENGVSLAQQTPLSTESPKASAKQIRSTEPAVPLPDTLIASLPGMEETGSAEDRQETYVMNRIVELEETAMTDKANALGTILPELSNGDPRIRQAALDAAGQLDNPESIPALKDACAQAETPEEKIRLQKAIDFLALSSESTN